MESTNTPASALRDSLDPFAPSTLMTALPTLAETVLHALTALLNTHANALLDTRESIAKSTSTSAHQSHVKTAVCALIKSTTTCANAQLDGKARIAKSTLTSACWRQTTDDHWQLALITSLLPTPSHV
jgi:hypothetical protein